MKKQLKLFLIISFIIAMLVSGVSAGSDEGSDSFTFANDLHIRKGNDLNGNVVVVFGDAIIDGKVAGDIAVIFGDALVNGEVGGNAVTVFGSVKVGKEGVINDSVAAVMGDIKKEPGGVIKGEEAGIGTPFKAFGRKSLKSAISIFSIIGLLVVFGFSSLLLLIIPRRMNIMADSIEFNMWRKFGIGAIAYLLFIPVIIALAISIIGLLLIPFFIPLFLITVFIGMTAIKIAIGKRLSGTIEGSGASYIYLIIGTVLVFILPYIPILGWLTYLLITCIGLGVVLDTRLGRESDINL